MTPEGFFVESGEPAFSGLCSDDGCQGEGNAGDSRNDKAAENANMSTSSADRIPYFDLITHLIIDP
tara:strand:+ start:156322 stop:156519 length:198 start_codon:yes stop_codon:yes gene_type:complete